MAGIAQRVLSIASLTLCVVLSASTVQAEEAETESGLRVNRFGIFIGSTEAEDTHSGEKDDPRFTVGLNYERRFSRLVGVTKSSPGAGYRPVRSAARFMWVLT